MNLRAPLLALVLACSASLPAALATSGLNPAQARSAAEAIIEGLRRNDSQAIYNLLAPDLQRATTPERIRQRLQLQEPILGSRIKEVLGGADDSTVEADLITAKGTRPLVLVVDDRGRLLGWERDLNDTPIKQVAANFVNALSQGKVVEARGLLSLELQGQLRPQDMLNRWKDLEKLTGTFQRVRGTVVASQGGDQQLVLVTTQFNRLTDNLFVILDASNHIIGIDFPEELKRQDGPVKP
ncbi:DUF3887 domain-containing protein [Synechococcus sp. Tobar12-5m-g]|uniref:DUF3887 domain-containing protein n=1 Tax=unclassified Synechococcus TaxID=2626047 RepID=UPI0020CE18F3|nr:MULTISPECIES: DUF3887 domain-containing protein [unclassified Synechococcus]MCP9771857.1 DUF3887 domain-containing protein [Synechococcus sp. Tobar12-5m-g]MCP9872799.1 DUF3887 domain-containing protein [Synechococcus sp. Cruz CV-v-12]